MGLLRTFLALAVVAGHTTPLFGLTTIGGIMAVQAFYVISGFYMALILNEKYVGQNDSYKLFLSNRFLRLYPAYWVVLVLTLLLSLASYFYNGRPMKLGPFLDYRDILSPLSYCYFALSNILAFGHDIAFVALDKSTGQFFLTAKIHFAELPVYCFLLVPQAWTIGYEMMFYLIAPFLVRRKAGLLVAMLSASLLLRCWLYGRGFDFDPWNYRFFPTELAFFLAGAVAYRAYGYLSGFEERKVVLRAVTLSIFAATLLYPYVSDFPFKQWAYYALFVSAIPFVFLLFRGNKVDQWIGELSYPIYISHRIFIMIGEHFLKNHLAWLGVFTAAASIVFSLLLIRVIIRPIEGYRSRRLKSLMVSPTLAPSGFDR